MIVVPVTNSESGRDTDAASICTLVPDEKVPAWLVPLTYSSLLFSVVPFAFSLVNLVTVQRLPPLYSIPIILAYVFTIPFHVASLLVAWQHARQVDTTLPFEPTSYKTIFYTLFLAFSWLFAAITSAVGSRRFGGICGGGQFAFANCVGTPIGRVITITAVAAALAMMEMAILLGIVFVCFRARPRKKVPVEEVPMETIPSSSGRHKVLAP